MHAFTVISSDWSNSCTNDLFTCVQLIGLSKKRRLFIYMCNCEIISDQSTLVRTHIINTYIKAISVNGAVSYM